MYLKASFLGLLEPAETEVYASAFGERFYGTTARALRESENEIDKIFTSEPAIPTEKLLGFQRKPRRLFLAFPFHTLPEVCSALQVTSW